MEDGASFQSDSMVETFPVTVSDFDLMDELLSAGCWLETAEGSNFMQQPGQSTSAALFDSSYFLPASEFNHGRLNPVSSESDEERTKASNFPENPSPAGFPAEVPVRSQSLSQSTVAIAEGLGQLQRYPAEGSSELVRRWWIGPRVNLVPSSSVRERLMHALRYIREFTKDRDTLLQIWFPTRIEGRNVLKTDDQLFSLESDHPRLAMYRDVSMNYRFSAEEGSDMKPGLPGRVFLGKVPEWTPDVRFFHSDEFPRVPHAQKYDVRGTLALPIFERSSRTCLGVVEVVMTTQKINYRSELDGIRKALEAVDLRSSEASGLPHEQAHKKSYEAVLPEIQEVLRTVCETHGLPLAQTWVPCIQQGKGGCRHSDENFAACVSTEDSACYVASHSFLGFHEACSEHHLFRGQGVAGKAFTTNQPCFSSDITTYSKADYPLLHYAKMFQLRAAVAIRLRSIYTGTTDYVLEFFLPVACQDIEEQRMMLNSLSMVIKRVCWSLRVLTDKELQEEPVFHIGEVGSSKGKLDAELPKLGSNTEGSPHEEPSWISRFVEAQPKDKTVPLEFKKEKLTEEFEVSQWDNPGLALQKGKMLSRQHHLDSGSKGGAECAVDSSFGRGNLSGAGKRGEKKRTKAEKTISLQVLRQYFAGSLKDAAKNIGVCPTTLKRICRQHGITRWPSRKIKKVGHSLRKLQVVIDSVQGAEGAFQIGSFYATFPDLTSPNLTGTSPFSTSKKNDNSDPLNTQPKGVVSPQPAISKSSSSSFSQTSSSNLCGSSGGITNQPQPTHLMGSEDASMAGNSGVSKRACNDAELHMPSKEEPKVLAQSENRKSIAENPSLESLAPLLKDDRHVSRDNNPFRVKVMYGEEKIRFSMQSNWRFKDLQQEIARRFNIDDFNRIDLKYLDDDSEWVLLTCDADLEECVGIYKSFQTNTIKLLVHLSSLPSLGSSLGSSVPS